MVLWAIGCALALGVVFAVLLGQHATPLPGTDAAEGSADDLSYEAYAEVLAAYVDDNGMVDYASLKADRRKLDEFVRGVGALNRRVFDGWEPKEKIAFWLNAYNALTLRVIVDHYPIKSGFFGGLRFPSNSIRQIKGVWDKIEFRVLGRKMTLEDIEHGTLRKEFDEPRIHMALVCAAMGCPLLRDEPYLGEGLDEQLDDQARKFLADGLKFRIDRRRKEVHLSPIFKWFGDDFVRTYGTKEGFPGQGEKERAVLNYVSRYLSEEDRSFLATAKLDVEYLDYDWLLNEQKRDDE